MVDEDTLLSPHGQVRAIVELEEKFGPDEEPKVNQISGWWQMETPSYEALAKGLLTPGPCGQETLDTAPVWCNEGPKQLRTTDGAF